MIGIGTPRFFATASTAFVVQTPSATECMPPSTSSSFFPSPSARPTERFRPVGNVVVVIRSPIPERPKNVFSFAPSATPRRAISTIPRVSSAAFAL